MAVFGWCQQVLMLLPPSCCPAVLLTACLVLILQCLLCYTPAALLIWIQACLCTPCLLVHPCACLNHGQCLREIPSCSCAAQASDSDDEEGQETAIKPELVRNNPALDKVLAKIRADFDNAGMLKTYTTPWYQIPDPMRAMSLDPNEWALKGSAVYICAWDDLYPKQMRMAFNYPPGKQQAVPPCPCCQKVDHVVREGWMCHARQQRPL
jgi:hypothetical protein